jgi:hypothetical protein
MATYFSQFPQILYSLDGKSVQTITDFLRRVSSTQYAQSTAVLYQQYTVNDGETAEMLADAFYGDAELFWVIYIINNIVDPRYDWCLSDFDLMAYCNNKYENIYATHHYENSNGLVVDQGAGTVSVSNLDYEISINENKRQIKILLPQLVNEFVQEFNTAINQ